LKNHRSRVLRLQKSFRVIDASLFPADGSCIGVAVRTKINREHKNT